MELVLSRVQEKVSFGGFRFGLSARLRLTDEETADMKRYGLEDEPLYANDDRVVTVKDLLHGKSFYDKDVLAIMKIEGELRATAQGFRRLVVTAATFEGEEVIELE